jgi:hypothetical protein
VSKHQYDIRGDFFRSSNITNVCANLFFDQTEDMMYRPFAEFLLLKTLWGKGVIVGDGRYVRSKLMTDEPVDRDAVIPTALHILADAVDSVEREMNDLLQRFDRDVDLLHPVPLSDKDVAVANTICRKFGLSAKRDGEPNRLIVDGLSVTAFSVDIPERDSEGNPVFAEVGIAPYGWSKITGKRTYYAVEVLTYDSGSYHEPPSEDFYMDSIHDNLESALGRIAHLMVEEVGKDVRFCEDFSIEQPIKI